jgi:Fe-S-cluster-containing dehydrogenase component
MNKYALFIDDYACWGCKACEVGRAEEGEGET